MREIKFRAWNPYLKIMMTPRTLYEPGFPSQCYDYLMQYTGKKDKNGVEIYKGDYLNTFNGDIVEIEWDDDFAGFAMVGAGIDDLLDSVGGCEVIGNIYENPELAA